MAAKTGPIQFLLGFELNYFDVPQMRQIILRVAMVATLYI